MPTASRLLRAIAALSLAIGLAWVPLAQVAACSCMQPTIEGSLEFSDVVFAGTAVAVAQPPQADVMSSADPVRYQFEVDSVFRGGGVAEALIATTAMDGASCGTAFGIGERWLVFATMTEGEAWTGLCSGNILLTDENADEVLAQLPTPVDPEAAPAEPAGGVSIPTPILLGGGVLLALIGLSAWAFVIEPRRAR